LPSVGAVSPASQLAHLRQTSIAWNGHKVGAFHGPGVCAQGAHCGSLSQSSPERSSLPSMKNQGPIQSLERAQLEPTDQWQGCDGLVMRTSPWAPQPLAVKHARGQIQRPLTGGGWRRESRVMNRVLADILTRNSCGVWIIFQHKPKEDRWLRAHPNVALSFPPTHAAWLNQIEFGLVS